MSLSTNDAPPSVAKFRLKAFDDLDVMSVRNCGPMLAVKKMNGMDWRGYVPLVVKQRHRRNSRVSALRWWRRGGLHLTVSLSLLSQLDGELVGVESSLLNCARTLQLTPSDLSLLRACLDQITMWSCCSTGACHFNRASFVYWNLQPTCNNN